MDELGCSVPARLRRFPISSFTTSSRVVAATGNNGVVVASDGAWRGRGHAKRNRGIVLCAYASCDCHQARHSRALEVSECWNSSELSYAGVVERSVYKVGVGRRVCGMQSTGRLMWWNLTRAVLPTRRTVAMATTGSGQSKRALKGVVFDMDGTLTVPCIDFRLMYRRVLGDDHPGVVNNSPIDILHEISGWSPEKQVQAFAIITEIEKEAHGRLRIMPGAQEVCSFLDSHRIPRGLITRNVKDSVDFFHSLFDLPAFCPALSREFTPYKPSPAPLLHICKLWGVPPSQVMMVGDSAPDDIVCGNRAGAVTCLLDESSRFPLHDLPEEQRPTHKINSLLDLSSLLQTYNLQSLDAGLPSQGQD